MTTLSWIGSETSIEDALVSLNYSKSQVKKCGLTKKQRLKTIKKGSLLEIPKSLFNRFEANPSFGDTDAEPSIISQTDDFLSISKPSYVHSHPLHYFERDNLISFLKMESLFSFLRPNNDKSFDRGLLYRLDYETSGLVVLTSSESFLDDLRKGVVAPELKLYQAVVVGDYKGPLELVNKLSGAGKKVYSDEQGKLAHLAIEKKSYNSELDMSLLEVTLKEGLRHQIRAQLSLAGYPILGDVLYGAKASELDFGLHCFQYDICSTTFKDESFNLLQYFSNS